MSETSTLSTGTVTFLFTDIEGSTRLWEQQTEAMHHDLARHDALLRAAIEDHDGHVFKTVGDDLSLARLQQRRADVNAQRADVNAAAARREAEVAQARQRDAVEAKGRATGLAEAEAERKAAHRARVAETTAQTEAAKSRRLLYGSQISLAQRACDVEDRAYARELLVSQWPGDGHEDLRGFDWRYLWHLAHRDDTLTTLNPGGPVYTIAFSPDGKLLATSSWLHIVKIWDVASRRPTRIIWPTSRRTRT
jgi:class 3 adenylate cyclase